MTAGSRSCRTTGPVSLIPAYLPLHAVQQTCATGAATPQPP